MQEFVFYINLKNSQRDIYSTVDVLNTVPPVKNLLINTIFLSRSAQIAVGTIFRKHTLFKTVLVHVLTKNILVAQPLNKVSSFLLMKT